MQIIEFPAKPFKAERFSPAARVTEAYRIAEYSAGNLVDHDDWSKAHRDMIRAHMGFLLSRNGPEGTADFVASLAGMCGYRTVKAAPEPPANPQLEAEIEW